MKKFLILLVIAMEVFAFTSCSNDDASRTTDCQSQYGYPAVTFDETWIGTWEGVDSGRMITISEGNITIDYPDGSIRSYCHAVQYATQHPPQQVFYNNLMLEPQLFLITDYNAYTSINVNIHQYGSDIINEVYHRID